MPSLSELRLNRPRLLVLAASLVVYAPSAPALEERAPDTPSVSAAKSQHQPPKPVRPARPKPLPAPVEEMRQAILSATQTGRIEDLIVPLDWNELKPDVSKDPVDDPIAYWKKVSADGEGREVLAALANVLQMRPAELPLGRDLENNIVYVWPYLAEAHLDQLTPAEEVDLLRLVPPEKAKAMREAKKWTWWRLAIGADGTWHSFVKEE